MSQSAKYGDPEPNTCADCDEQFPRDRITCPHCGSRWYYYNRHPRNDWTREYIEDLAEATAGFAYFHLELGADHEAQVWWADGELFGRSIDPNGNAEAFSVGFDEVFEEAKTIELRHWTGAPRGVKRSLSTK